MAAALKSQPVPTQPLRCVLRYLSASDGVMPARPDGTSSGISVVRLPVKRSGTAISVRAPPVSWRDSNADDKLTTASGAIGPWSCATAGKAASTQTKPIQTCDCFTEPPAQAMAADRFFVRNFSAKRGEVTTITLML